MFYLHASNRTENLLDHLGQLIKASPPSSFFDKETFIIQSQGMERMISQYLARRFTSWCNYQFLLPVAFLQKIAEALSLEITPDTYERSFLCWRIEDKLRSIDDKVYVPLQRYLQGEQADVKRYQLARQLANLFDQYQLMRPQMLERWETGRTIGAGDAESWQMHLWTRLVSETDAGRHRGELLRRVIDRLLEKETVTGIPQRVSLFGVHTLPPFYLEYLERLSHHCDIHLFLLSPCKEYWGDMRRKNADQSSSFLDHPLLVSLGRQGRDFQEMLLGSVEFADEFTSYHDPASQHPCNLLQKLQSDLLAGSIEESSTYMIAEEDRSIRIVSAHSRRRELEILKDYIIRVLECDSSIQLRDIVVMAPDIQEYAPFIPAVFEDIEHSIADRSLFRTNLYISIFTEFLELIGSRFEWSAVLDLLEKEPVADRFGLRQADFDLVRHWILSSGIRWGLSGKTRKRQGLEFDKNSWSAGLSRLLMGYAIDSREPVCGIYPAPLLEGGAAKILGGLCRFIDLLEKASRELEQHCELSQWSDLLARYAEELLGSSDQRDFLELIESLRKLRDYGKFHTGRVGIEVIGRWFESQAVEARTASGFLKGCLTFCSMLPMRSIPFRAVCLVGMNYGAFPANDRHATFDLMRTQPMQGDRSLRADDRYQFLEVLLSSRESLYISYVGRSLQTNDMLPPAVVVTELLEVIESIYRVPKDHLIEQHPLHSFSSRYFREDDPLFSYSELNCEISRKMQSGTVPAEQWWTGEVEDTQKEIEVAALIGFFTAPQEYFLKYTLGVSLADDADVPEPTELFKSAGLQAWSVNQYLLETELEGRSTEQLQTILQEDGLWPLGSPGDISFASHRDDVAAFAQAVQASGIGEKIDDIEIDIELDGYRIHGMVGSNYEGGTFLIRYGALRAKDLLVGWLIHSLKAHAGAEPARTEVWRKDGMAVFEDSDRGPSLKDLVDLYVDGLRRPSKLLLEPGLAFCRQLLSRRAKVDPLEKARYEYRQRLENGYEPAWSLVFGGADEEEVMDGRFARLAEYVLLPLWRKVS